MQFHSRTLLDGKGARGSTDEVWPSLDAMEGLDDDCSALNFSAQSDEFALIASGSIGAIMGALGVAGGKMILYVASLIEEAHDNSRVRFGT
jgi:hypothetical protein